MLAKDRCQVLVNEVSMAVCMRAMKAQGLPMISMSRASLGLLESVGQEIQQRIRRGQARTCLCLPMAQVSQHTLLQHSHNLFEQEVAECVLDLRH